MKEYIGDGVYAEYDGYGIWLRLGAERQNGTYEIYLENETYARLTNFVARIAIHNKQELEESQRQQNEQERLEK